MPLTIEELSPDLLHPPISGHLYHYTDNHGFLGITDKKALWATDYKHLNDHSEYRHACNLVCEIAEERASQEPNPNVKTQLILIAKFTKENRGASSIGLISFSESRDQLSQWRAYGRDGGYAISFDFKTLREIAHAKKWLLVRCEYDVEKQRELIHKLIDLALKMPVSLFGDVTLPSDSPHVGLLNISLLLQQFALIFKDSTFSEEKEWRLISPAVPVVNEPLEIKFRPGRSGIIPYFEFCLKTSAGLHPIFDGVIIGPRQEQNLAVEIARMVFAKQGIHHFPPPPGNVSPASLAQPSRIPYRMW